MAFLAKIKRAFVSHMTWVKNNFYLFVLLTGIMLLLGVVGVVGSYLAGFWLNGLYGYKFDLSHTWQGVGAIATGVATLWAVAEAAMKKYQIDSSLNSKAGEKPE